MLREGANRHADQFVTIGRRVELVEVVGSHAYFTKPLDWATPCNLFLVLEDSKKSQEAALFLLYIWGREAE